LNTTAIAVNIPAMTFESDMGLAQQKLQSGQYKHAHRAAKSAMKKSPRSPFAPNFAGIALGRMGKHREAVALFKKALKLDPHYHEARRNLAQSLILLGDVPTALTLLGKLVALTPKDADAWYLLAQAAAKAGQTERAEEAAGRSIECAPNQARAYNLRALMRDRLGQIGEALADYETALRLNPDDVETLINIGLPLARQTRYEEAMQAVRRAVELAPEHVGAGLRLAMQLVESGENEQAVSELRRVLEISPAHSEAIEQLAQLQNADQNRDLEPLARAALKMAPRKSIGRANLQFALARIAEQNGQRAEADDYLAGANRDMAAIQPYDSASDSTLNDRLLKRFDTPIASGMGDDPTPIYVVGLPRSGTTLAEAILGAHPDVVPLGERAAAGILLQSMIRDDLPFDTQAAVGFVASDRKLLPEMPKGTRAYVDKMPENYRLLGFLATAYPQAKFINLRRDPRDIALSMWRGHFSGTALAYTYDLKAMAHRFNLYASAMQHWRKTMPNTILDLHYEDMVDDIEAASRRIAEFCGLNWTAEMARPDQNAGQVLTLSATQLRQPVHNRSVGKWRQHETLLAPFLEGLDSMLWPEIT